MLLVGDVGTGLEGDEVDNGVTASTGVSLTKSCCESLVEDVEELAESLWEESNRLELKCGIPHEQQCHHTAL